MVVAHELNRLGRSFADLAGFVEELRAKGIDIDLINQPIGTVGEDDWMAEMMVNMMMICVDAERKMIRSRVQEEIDATIADGGQMDAQTFIHMIEWMIQRYRYRWSIENSFKKQKHCMVRTTSTDTPETEHQRTAINDWLDEHRVDAQNVDRYADPGHSVSDPNAIDRGQYEIVVVWEISRLGSIYQRFFERCEDAGTTVAITDGWVKEVHPDGTEKLIADISAAVAEEERRRLIKRVEAGVTDTGAKTENCNANTSTTSEIFSFVPYPSPRATSHIDLLGKARRRMERL